MRRCITVALLVLGLALPVQATGAGPSDEAERLGRDMEQAAREAATELLGVITLFISRIPTYEAPEVLENGDIIIRRKHPRAEAPPQPVEKPRSGANGEVTDL